MDAPATAANAGRITKVLVKQGISAKKNQPLAVVETLNTPGETFTLNAPQNGKIGFVDLVQPGIFLRPGQVVFTIHPANEQFFGMMGIPPYNINKIKEGQQVLISLRNYPTEEYGQLKGTVSYVADDPGKGGLFTVKVTLNKTGLKQPIQLKSWMTGDAGVVTENMSLQGRIYKSIIKGS